jgi:maleylacetoacetate isomerase
LTQLYSFFNSSTSYRVRIALELKGKQIDYVPTNIRTLEHRAPDYTALNPSKSVPTLVNGDMHLGQSIAIIDYLDSMIPEPRLIPLQQPLRARVLELSLAIACDIHPINNLRVLRYLQESLQIGTTLKDDWYKHWVSEGMEMVEGLLQKHGAGPFCFGETPTLADCCLIPQIANALRMGCDLRQYSRAMSVYDHCIAMPEFLAAAPQAQLDYVA